MKLDNLTKEVTSIYEHLVEIESTARQMSKTVHPNHQSSVLNLIRYLVLRNYDLRQIHDTLSEYGISSLRSAEAYTLKNVVDVLKLVHLLQQQDWTPDPDLVLIGYEKSRKLRHLHANELFNEIDQLCFTEIMVTMPSEAAEDRDLVRRLIKAGMEIGRINLSHDNEEVWRKIADNIRQCSKELDIPCKIAMDLGGPKIRIESILVRQKQKVRSTDRILVNNEMEISFVATGNMEIKGKSKEKKKYELVGLQLSLPEIFEDVKIGERVFFDDGKVRGRIIDRSSDKLTVRIEAGAEKGAFLKVEKGVNLPDSDLKLASLTEEDMAILPYAMDNADIISYSFIRKPKDVEMLYEILGERLDKVGILLKIETQEACQNLPLILIEGMKSPKLGVMIARGDLAVEIGPERMSEIQDEIMWICEAAHVPVVWATEVLDRLAKKGRPTRSEITDAAASVRAECVMLNKGPHIVEAVSLLKRILIKMEMHTSKKKSKMRPLSIAMDALKYIDSKRVEHVYPEY